MKHVYLTIEQIDLAYRKGGITLMEVDELRAKLERCAKHLQTR